MFALMNMFVHGVETLERHTASLSSVEEAHGQWHLSIVPLVGDSVYFIHSLYHSRRQVRLIGRLV